MSKVNVVEAIKGTNYVRGDIVTNGHFILLVTSQNNVCISGVIYG